MFGIGKDFDGQFNFVFVPKFEKFRNDIFIIRLIYNMEENLSLATCICSRLLAN